MENISKGAWDSAEASSNGVSFCCHLHFKSLNVVHIFPLLVLWSLCTAIKLSPRQGLCIGLLWEKRLDALVE